VTLVPRREDIRVDYEAGETIQVELHDGTVLVLHKLEHDHDPTDREAAARLLRRGRTSQQLVTGLLYVNPDQPTLFDMLGQVETPLASLGEAELRPNRASLDRIIASLQ
jgi:2-oxoglutarate ferredoxin oxidoreductase subunit beta